MAMEFCCSEDTVSFTAMVVVEIGFVGFTTVSKAAMARGLSRYVFIVYYQALAALILLPVFLFQRRKTPPLTLSFLCRFFLLGLIGTSAAILGFTGLDYSSPTLSSALSNLVPAFTFIVACIFRMEKFDIRSKSSQAKALGTTVSIGGAIVATLYKGEAILVSSSVDEVKLNSSPESNWVIGGSFLVAAWILMSIWYILQAATVKQYPAEFSLAFFNSFFVTILSAVFTLVAERNPKAWTIRPDTELIAIVYSALIGSILNVTVHTWCLRIKGPIYVAIFKPFGIVIAVIMSSIFLRDTLYSGSVIGSIVITFGFYGVLWGKSKEQKVIEDVNVNSLESSPGAPLLINIEDNMASTIKD